MQHLIFKILWIAIQKVFSQRVGDTIKLQKVSTPMSLQRGKVRKVIWFCVLIHVFA